MAALRTTITTEVDREAGMVDWRVVNPDGLTFTGEVEGTSHATAIRAAGEMVAGWERAMSDLIGAAERGEAWNPRADSEGTD